VRRRFLLHTDGINNHSLKLKNLTLPLQFQMYLQGKNDLIMDDFCATAH